MPLFGNTTDVSLCKQNPNASGPHGLCQGHPFSRSRTPPSEGSEEQPKSVWHEKNDGLFGGAMFPVLSVFHMEGNDSDTCSVAFVNYSPKTRNVIFRQHCRPVAAYSKLRSGVLSVTRCLEDAAGRCPGDRCPGSRRRWAHVENSVHSAASFMELMKPV